MVEAAGAPGTFDSCVEAAGSLGRIVVIGIPNRASEFNQAQLQRKELTVMSSRNSTRADFGSVRSSPL
ncbi:hypothetical protein BSZ39_13055 [Bowdeniella nasicola]|uniref:Alcohol dehydrogenase-like C-terminal domain-containing protein n=1 Tax=Bowdeniella nasicola TaxID=208480 RepID=A0A1Q5PS41_9ACTO|nr:hypothetical protein BSZ39_13055 [Bowdeniella nasicola]